MTYKLKYPLAGLTAALTWYSLHAPLIHLPVTGSTSFLENGKSDGNLVLLLVCLATALFFAKRWILALALVSAAWGVMLAKFGNLWVMLDSAQRRLASMAGSEQAEMMKNLMQEAYVEWGLGLLVLSAGSLWYLLYSQVRQVR